MHPPLSDISAPVEKQVAIADLNALTPALLKALGAHGVGGTDLESLLSEHLEAVCLGCGIRLRGSDLVFTALEMERSDLHSSKRQRLRMGYCARKDCAANYYLLRFLPCQRVDWELVSRSLAHSATAQAVVPVKIAPPLEWRTLLPAPSLQRLMKPVPLCMISLMAVTLLLRSGCYVPGITAKARVFIVSDTAPVTPNPPANPP
jgi:hypothetical protein